MSFIKQHWFGLLTGLFIFCVLAVFVLVLLSPRQDVQKRGFIPCTEEMADKMLSCQKNKIWCMLGAVIENSWCDMKIVGNGIGLWATAKQSAPWSNYIFIPELPAGAEFNAAAQEEYRQSNPDPVAEMLELKQLNEELENEQPEPSVDPIEQPR